MITEKMVRNMTYIALLTVVEVVLYLIGDRLPVMPDWAFYPMLGLAAFRGGRAVSFNGVFVWLRELLKVYPSPDSSGAGDSNAPHGKGPLYVLGELTTCPICSATWVGMGLLLLLALVPHMGNGMIILLGAAGIAEVLHWLSERLEWSGRYYREESGSHWYTKNGELPPGASQWDLYFNELQKRDRGLELERAAMAVNNGHEARDGDPSSEESIPPYSRMGA